MQTFTTQRLISFGDWMQLIRRRLISLGLDHESLADWPSRQSYDDGCSPDEGVIIALECSDMPADLIDDLVAA
jgi:hypothetical protein